MRSCSVEGFAHTGKYALHPSPCLNAFEHCQATGGSAHAALKSLPMRASMRIFGAEAAGYNRGII